MTEAGTIDPPEVADLGPADLRSMYRHLVLARRTEERLEVLFRQGHVHGGLYRSLGQEGEAVGAAYALRRRDDSAGDVIAHTIRDTSALFLFGGTPLEYFRQYLGRATAPARGRDGNVHYTDFRRGFVAPVSPLGTMVEIMAGITLSFRMSGDDRVGLVFAGDGSTSTGAFHEGLNFAAVRRCPMILILEANKYAFSTPTEKQTRVERFVDKAPGYGIAAERVDGNDVLAVYEATRRAAGRARAGEGVTLIECDTYRRLGHAQHDAQAYVSRDELERWEARDPIRRFRERLRDSDVVSDDELAAIDDAVEEEVAEAARRAVDEPLPDPGEALEEIHDDGAVPVPWTRLPDPDPHRRGS